MGYIKPQLSGQRSKRRALGNEKVLGRSRREGNLGKGPHKNYFDEINGDDRGKKELEDRS